MPLTHAVEHQFAVFLGREVVTAAELRSRLAAVLATTRLAERPLLLFDLRDVVRLDLAREDVEDLCQIVERAGPAAKGARFAFVAEAEAVSRTAASFAALAAALPIEVRVFREIGEARSWLACAELSL
jgi:hypothetical protein